MIALSKLCFSKRFHDALGCVARMKDGEKSSAETCLDCYNNQ